MKYVFYTFAFVLGFSGVAFASVTAYNSLIYHVDPPVWQFFPDQNNLSTQFTSSQQVNVYKFTDKDSNATCFVTLAPSIFTSSASSQARNFTTSISCIK